MPARIQRFVLMVKVSCEYLVHAPEAEEMAWDMVRLSALNLRGPRGGRYRAIWPVQRAGRVEDFMDFFRDEVSFVGRVQGRYVRPARQRNEESLNASQSA